MNKNEILAIIDNCKKSFTYFCENFCKIKHANAPAMPFKLFKYQRDSIASFRKHNRVIYLKCRQSGISTLTGAYALWVAMFFPNKKVLIVSKRDEDAMGYLNRNVKFVYENLPEFFWKIWGDPRSGMARKFDPCTGWNEHIISFYQGSEIRSLTSSKDTLRSNAASLVIIDEAAFIPDMEDMWSAGQPTLMHGGSVIVISTVNGRGNWYSNTIDEAKVGSNNFKLIEIPWYGMDWVLEWYDPISGNKIRIAPCDGLRKSETDEEKALYGEWVSPWLIQQYRELQSKGDAWKFRQEFLMEFIGAGNTVLSREALIHLESQVDNKYKTPTKQVSYSNAQADIVNMPLYFGQDLWVWEMPKRPEPPVITAGKIIKPGIAGHRYSLGADISSGEAADWSAIVVLDATENKQVAELMVKCETHVFAKMIDWIGRFYNNALAVVESVGLGKPVVQELKSVYWYPNLYYRRLPSGKRDKTPGFPTSGASKAHIVKAITDNMGTDTILYRSSRLNKQANCFIHLGGDRVGNEPGTNNNDDLMIAGGLAALGVMDALSTPDGLIPTSSRAVEEFAHEKIELTMDDILQRGGHQLMYPIIMSEEPTMEMSMEQELLKFATQLGGLSKETVEKHRALPRVVTKKHTLG